MIDEEPLGDKPAPDVAEQQRPVSADGDEADDVTDPAPPFEADDADVAEQRQAVPIPPDEDSYDAALGGPA